MGHQSPQDKFEEGLSRVVDADPRYRMDAYLFIYQALDYTQAMLERGGHVSGKELLEGIRKLNLQEFGLMANTVLESWGVKTTDDFGEIVFNLVENGLLKKTDQDTRREFKNVYSFDEAFDQSFNIAADPESGES